MNVLGISAYYHDASAAVVHRGQLAGTAAEERFTRIKHDASYPAFAVEHCLRAAGVNADELDAVVFYERPYVKFTRVLDTFLDPATTTRRDFTDAARGWLGEKLWLRNHLSHRLNVHPRLVEFVDHHDSHAAQAFLQSGYDEAAILTVDAVGEWATTTISVGRSGDSVSIRRLMQLDYPHSLGLLYSTFTAFLGFRPNDGECSTMALASFGTPRYVESVRAVLRLEADGSYEVDPSYVHFERRDGPPFSRRFIELFGLPRNPRAPLPFDAMSDEQAPASKDDLRYADIAASVQVVLEDALLGLARRARELTGMESLCVAGGVALNCVAMTRVATEAGFTSVFIPPDPGDGGAAAGAALLAADAPSQRVSSYLGPRYATESSFAMIRSLDWRELVPYRSSTASPYRDVRVETLDEQRVADRAVDLLRDGKVVGWYQGSAENGPRALGNRSILCDPANRETARRMSRWIKRRAPFRPYALAFAAEDFERIVEQPQKHDLGAWMQRTYALRPEALRSVRAAAHVDGTTRAQICTATENPVFHRLLRAFGQTTGIAALLNTSMNEPGMPIVGTPEDAAIMFVRSDMDALVIDDVLLEKIR